MIKKFISNAMLSIVMDKQAKDKLLAARENRKTGKRQPAPPPPEKIPVVQGQRTQTETMDRQDLIRSAIALHKEKSKVLDDLSEDDRRKLQLLALQTMMGKGSRKS